MEILHERYGSKQVLIGPHKQKLDKLLRTKSSTDIRTQRKMVDEIEVCLTNLKVLNINTASYQALIVTFLNEKLSSGIRLILS